MEQIPQLIASIATLLWPIILLIVLVVFRPAVAVIIDSAKSRKFTLKIGGQELTMEEASQEERNLIADMQAQIVDLRKKIEGTKTALPVEIDELAPESQPLTSVLWVDDNPKNNSYFVEQLLNRGIRVDLALSTTEGTAKFMPGRYSYVISDMGRTENGRYIPDAGINLLKGIRQGDPNIPFVIFCSSRGVQEYGTQAKIEGVTGITSSGTVLFGLLNLEHEKLQT